MLNDQQTKTTPDWENIAGKLADILHSVWACSVANMGVMPSEKEMRKVLQEYERAKR